jgi:glycerophosphoryl diester phosphodiesterase
MSSRRILVQGHRGARAILPENSLAGFAYAIEVGADAVELDVAVTRDDVLVLSHDPELADPPCVIRERTMAELNGRLPTLADVFQLVAVHRIELNIELKSFPDSPQYTPAPRDFAQLVVDLTAQYGMESRVMVESFDLRVVHAMHEIAPHIRRGALTESPADNLVQIAGNATFVAPHYTRVTPDAVRECHAAGLQVIPWTVNAPEDWARMAEADVDAIITDDPAPLLEWLRGPKLKRLAAHAS